MEVRTSLSDFFLSSFFLNGTAFTPPPIKKKKKIMLPYCKKGMRKSAWKVKSVSPTTSAQTPCRHQILTSALQIFAAEILNIQIQLGSTSKKTCIHSGQSAKAVSGHSNFMQKKYLKTSKLRHGNWLLKNSKISSEKNHIQRNYINKYRVSSQWHCKRGVGDHYQANVKMDKMNNRIFC